MYCDILIKGRLCLQIEETVQFFLWVLPMLVRILAIEVVLEWREIMR